MIPKNVQIRTIERPGAIDRYGQPVYETIQVRFFARLETRSFMVKTSNGDVMTFDGSLLVDTSVDISSKDRVTLDTRPVERYTIYDVVEERGVLGTVEYKRARLVKIRESA